MVVPNSAGGGQTVYSRVADDFGYTVSQVSTNAVGKVTLSTSGYQATLSADIVPIGASWQTDSQSGSSAFDGDIRIDAVTDTSNSNTTTLTANDTTTG